MKLYYVDSPTSRYCAAIFSTSPADAVFALIVDQDLEPDEGDIFGVANGVDGTRLTGWVDVVYNNKNDIKEV